MTTEPSLLKKDIEKAFQRSNSVIQTIKPKKRKNGKTVKRETFEIDNFS